MSPMESWVLIVVSGAAIVAIVIALDWWMDSRPGGRKYDEQLEHLRAYERYLTALERQQKRHIRIGHREKK